jgi:hypothetical protein
MGHHVIRPVERDCICPTRPSVSHTDNCESAFREKFFASWQRERDRFYGPDRDLGRREAPGPGVSSN